MPDQLISCTGKEVSFDNYKSFMDIVMTRGTDISNIRWIVSSTFTYRNNMMILNRKFLTDFTIHDTIYTKEKTMEREDMEQEELLLRGAISMMPQEDQDKIFSLCETFLSMVKDDEQNGFIAFTLASLKILEEQKNK